MNKQIWVGLAEVKPLPGCALLEEAKGAYVHVMAWAVDPLEFRNRVALRGADLSLEIVSLSQTMPWTVRNSGDADVRAEFYEMQDRVEDDVKAVAFGRFHAWLKDQPV